MSYDDFMKNFDVIDICHLTLDSLSSELLKSDDDSDLKWNCLTFHSKWEVGKTSGGTRRSAKYWTNPQYMIELIDVDMNDNENKATLIVSLMRKNARKSSEGIKFEIYKVKFILFKHIY